MNDIEEPQDEEQLPPGSMTVQVLDGAVFLAVPDVEQGVTATVEMEPRLARQLGSALFKAGSIAEGLE